MAQDQFRGLWIVMKDQGPIFYDLRVGYSHYHSEASGDRWNNQIMNT